MDIFEAIGTRRLDFDTCFLCGIELADKTRSDEHVVPKWLQHKFDLWNKRITLLNGSTIPYRQLTIPCCNTCNNNYLSKIENSVRQPVEASPLAVAELGKTTLFIWLGKIFYGLIFRELSLPLDRSDPSAGTIVSDELIRQFRMHHYFLQSVRVPMSFQNFFPASIYIFELQSPTDILKQFDLRDDLPRMTMFVRMGNVGILASLQDGGAQQDARQRYFGAYQGLPLHPIQFEELGANFFYAASIFNRTPKYMTAEQNGKVEVSQAPLAGLSGKPLFDKWEMSEYAKFLSVFVGRPMEDVHPYNDQVLTWLSDGKSEKFLFMEIESNP